MFENSIGMSVTVNPVKTIPKRIKSPKIMKLKEDILEANSPPHSPTTIKLMSAEFLPFP